MIRRNNVIALFFGQYGNKRFFYFSCATTKTTHEPKEHQTGQSVESAINSVVLEIPKRSNYPSPHRGTRLDPLKIESRKQFSILSEQHRQFCIEREDHHYLRNFVYTRNTDTCTGKLRIFRHVEVTTIYTSAGHWWNSSSEDRK